MIRHGCKVWERSTTDCYLLYASSAMQIASRCGASTKYSGAAFSGDMYKASCQWAWPIQGASAVGASP